MRKTGAPLNSSIHTQDLNSSFKSMPSLSSHTNRSASIRPKKRPYSDSKLNSIASCSDNSDSEYSESDNEEPAKKKAKTVGRAPLASVTFRTNLPMSTIPKDYNPMSVLAKKFTVPFLNSPSSENSTLLTKRTLGVRPTFCNNSRALHDHTSENAIVLYDPATDDMEKPNDQEGTGEVLKPKKSEKSLAEILGIAKKKESAKVPVVVDPILARVLRPHQVEGVKFLYNCSIGKTMKDAYGCIMADEMGLGKTLQCITLLWTLLRQSPEPGKPTIEKCIIACPSSLVRNWDKELGKWLNSVRIQAFTVDNHDTKEKLSQQIKHWASAQGRMVVNPVMIISYESLRQYVGELNNCYIGLLLCDEGHRLKNSNSLTFQALNSLKVDRRVILSGTPVQNDLSEYFSLLNFANPGLLGSTAEFRKNYENPILRGRDSAASEKEREIGDAKIQELWGVVSKFIIRRSNDILSKYLPVKYEHVVFCHLSPFQLSVYKHFTEASKVKKLLKNEAQTSQAFKAIGILKKLVNHPDLINFSEDIRDCDELFPQGYNSRDRARVVNSELSGKMIVLERMLSKIRQETKDKIVLISNYTQTLDLFERLCRQKKWGTVRLDGTLTIQKRAKVVDQFNDPDKPEFICLLSSKAGGCGLNLIGANRLVLFDPDWNPATDQQALARVWRDGQTKPCFIYRFITTGTIEEKILQRQGHKQALSNCVVDESSDVERHFSLSEIRKLFELNLETICDTHDTYKCKRCLNGKQVQKAQSMHYGDASTWDHYSGGSELLKIPDPILKEEAEKNTVSYVFQYISHTN